MTSGLSGSPAPQTSRRASLQAAKILLDQQAPHRGRRAEGGDGAALEHAQQRLGVERRLVDHEDRGAGVPRREERAPGMLGPAGRGDVHVHVAGLQTQPVHRRQGAHGVTAMAVPHQLGLGGRARGEIEQERVVGVGRTVRLEIGRAVVGIAERLPAVDLRGAGRHEHHAVARQAGAFRDLVLVGHDHAGAAALDAIGQFLAGEQRRRGDHHDAQLHGGQHDLPQRRHVVEDEQQMVAAPQALLAQIVGDLVRARLQLGEGEPGLLAGRHIDDPERAAVLAVGGVRQLGVEPVERPVERDGLRPLEAGHGLVVVCPIGQQELA